MNYRTCTLFAVAALVAGGCMVVQEKPADSAPPAPAAAEPAPAAATAEPAPAQTAAPAEEPKRPPVRQVGGESEGGEEEAAAEEAETEAAE